jgi:hypothetical protein
MLNSWFGVAIGVLNQLCPLAPAGTCLWLESRIFKGRAVTSTVE